MQFLRYQVRFQFTVHCNASEAERTKWENLRAGGESAWWRGNWIPIDQYSD